MPLLAAKTGITAAHHTLIPRWISSLGVLGLFASSVLDASIIPLPVPGTTDLLLLWLVSHSGNPWLLAAIAIAGSIAGGYTTWNLGRKGGEAALSRHVRPSLLERVRGWMKRNPMLAVFLPAVLPPPIPLSPFLLAAGALGIPRGRFVAAFAAARGLRYGLVAWVGLKYGRRMIRMWSATFDKWSAPLLWAFGVIVVAGAVIAFIKLRRSGKAGEAKDPAREAAAD
jgi:membrane protein YqaA with SNARE-associated domain